METWQKDHIRKNLLTLIQDTVCSSSFLVSLSADGIVSDDDIQILEAISTQRAQAKRFYEIIQTRRNSFNPLKQALQDTAQSGALAILEQCKQHTARIPFQNCGSISYFHKVLLGKGGYGTKVFKGMFENREVAVKRLDRDEVEMADAQGEVSLQILLDSHKNVVRYFKTEVSDEYIFIALELCDVNLFDWEVIKQTTEGVAHLHSNQVIHRDLKPTNILLVSRSVGDTQVKISDFGLSKRIPVGVTRLSSHTAGVGSVEWMAPEVAGGLTFQNNVAVGTSFSSDVFSMGCIYYFVITSGLHPFGEPRRCQANIEDGKYQLLKENITAIEGDATEFIKLISKMISHKRGERPTALEVFTWLKDLKIIETQRSVIVPTHQHNAMEEESVKHASGITVDENPATVGTASAMTDKLRLTKDDEQTATQLTKFRGNVMATSDIRVVRWEDTKGPNLHLAIRRGDMPAIKELIQLGTDVNAKNSLNETPIMIAAASKADGTMTYDIVIYLMENGADAFVTDTEGYTFLHKLFLNSTTFPSEFAPFAQYLVDKRLSSLFNTQDITLGTTPLMLAVKNVELNRETITLLRQNGVNVALVDKNGDSYLSYAAEGNKNTKLLAELNRNGELKHNKLAEAIMAMDGDSVKALVRLGVDVNETNDYIGTPLHLAAGLKNIAFAIPIIKFLIDSGGNVDAKDECGKIFLHYFVLQAMKIHPIQFDDMSTYLISKGLSRLFNTYTMDLNHQTPFHFAVQFVEIERATLSLLKNNGVDFNAANSVGNTVLYYATYVNRTLRMISDLVELGANPKQILTYNKESMLHRAAHNGNADVVKFFVDKGLGINAQDEDRKTPLHYALTFDDMYITFEENAYRNYELKRIPKTKDVLKTVQILLQNGAKSDIVDKKGKSPRDYFNENRANCLDADKISTCFAVGPSC